MDSANLATLQQTLEVCFEDMFLLERALVHSSYINENPDSELTSNERLEFLGDAVLSLIVAEKLYQDFPNLAEGQLTKLRAALVRRDTLARIAQTAKLGEYLYLGKGEEASGGRDKPANLAAALEAVIAAVFLDKGTSFVKDFVLKLWATELQKVSSQDIAIDYKSELQELIQAREQRAPTYHVVTATGPDHNRVFNVEVRLGGVVLGIGSGQSKKDAESEAAHQALQKLTNRFTP